MLSVIFSVGSARYAVDLAAVVRIVPLAALTPLPAAAPEVAGLLDFHGSAIPVIDLNRLEFGSECPALIGTRIVLVRRRTADGSKQIFGLLASRVDIKDMDQAKDFLPNDLPLPAWLDRFLVCGGDVVQRIRPDVLVAEHLMLSAPVANRSIE